MSGGYPPETVIVSRESFECDDPCAIVESNAAFVNALFEEHLTPDELAADSLRSYHVDYYQSEANGGGLSQFVVNSHWEPRTIESVREGLRAMGAEKHLQLFESVANILDRLQPEQVEEFVDNEAFGKKEEREVFDGFDRRFEALDAEENLTELNSRWLRQLPNLVVLSTAELRAEIQRRIDAIPDRSERIAESLANEPRFMKLIRALCEAAGHDLQQVTGGNWHAHRGRWLLAWHFITDKGHHYMIDTDGKASMFDGNSHKCLCEIAASDEFGESVDVSYGIDSFWSRFRKLFGSFQRRGN